MTRGGLETEQKMVSKFIFETIKTPQNLQDGFSLETFGIEETVNFSDSLTYLARGLCLELQKRERGPSERIKDSDTKAAIKAPNPIEFLRGRGYSDRAIKRIFED